MITIDLSKHKGLDADPKQYTKIQGNLDPAGQTKIYFLMEEENVGVL